MIVLGIDTATPATVVGLTLADSSTLQARDDPTGEQRPGHATRLLPLASALLAEADLAWNRLQRIAVGVGPGTFTGLRIGIATARGLSQSLGIPLVGVSSLRALAHAIPGEDVGVLAVIDARRGEIFAAAYDGSSELLAPRPLPPDAIAHLLERASVQRTLERWIAVGDGAVRYRESIERQGVLVPPSDSELHRIRASAVCALGELATVGDSPVLPDYLRRPDAEIALEGAAS
ncbi:MAG TPA: tRNA (adenosine(37)-N6)-threonylcarbamoyltransferase complex dimerization subunit type 1 TsaB [Solirubrobacteraceae bacterium]|jgi:tRNA threonylcarbamoyladenosine biosynthesis protein TsaB|nr:tRNA (adenosine(37)-N6)-threonylcarbamoyltransferase complex dimerization subunit type 1 TsaB [Solirubrobacteraceae bacterium]